MNEAKGVYDVVIVGAGPAGMMAAYQLGRSNVRTLLLDQNGRLGGAAFATDVNLQNVTGFPPQSDFGERSLGSRALADQLVREAYQILCEHGLPPKKEMMLDRYSFAVGESTLKRVLNGFHGTLKMFSNLDIRLRATVASINRGTLKRWNILVEIAGARQSTETDHVVIAGGKLSATWLIEFLNQQSISYENCSRLAVGVRIEGLASQLNAVTCGCENPKIRVEVQGVISETFCWCKNGAVMAYDFGDARLLDGEHCYDSPQGNTSFGVITTLELPNGSSNTLASVAFARFMSVLGNGSVLLQRFGDFRAGKATVESELGANLVQPSLSGFKLCNIRSYYPSVAVEGLIAVVEEINRREPNTIVDESLMYAPILERIFPDVRLSHAFETNRPGVFLIGDCSGKGVGVAPAFVMGLASAKHISNFFGGAM